MRAFSACWSSEFAAEGCRERDRGRLRGLLGLVVRPEHLELDVAGVRARRDRRLSVRPAEHITVGAGGRGAQPPDHRARRDGELPRHPAGAGQGIWH